MSAPDEQHTQFAQELTPSAAPGPDVRLLSEATYAREKKVEDDQALRLCADTEQRAHEPAPQAIIRNDQAVLAAQAGDLVAALEGFRLALAIDPQCRPARFNLTFLEEPLAERPGLHAKAPAPGRPAPFLEHSSAGKVALVSFFFNWPTSGGGNVHTAELARFLASAGYTVRHFYPRYAAWGIGNVTNAPFPSEGLVFADRDWNVPAIQARLRQAVDAFGPDWVLITDSWNMKPHLAQAMRGYPIFLRFQALECLCPLNNVRLLFEPSGTFSQCPKQQLGSPEACRTCLQQRARQSGPLHQADRELAGVGTPEYHRLLLQTLQEAEAVLVLNPLTAAMLTPYARRVCVVPWGMDPDRFPWPPGINHSRPHSARKRLFIACVVQEAMKGFHVLHAACARLWRKRRDFELVATGEPAWQIDEFTRFVGWVAQEDLPRHYWSTDITVVPTIAQEGLSRTSVEAMAAGRPVVASRIGGLPFTVADGVTGLLCQPGNPDDLARKLEVLLDDPGLCERMGLAGRHRFEQEFAWDVVIERHYRPLLSPAPGTQRRE